MSNKPPYTHILKNLFHEQAAELMPLLLPEYWVEEAFDVEMPELKSTELERPATDLEEGFAELALPGAKIVKVYHTEWIEHSGKFERAYRVQTSESKEPTFLFIEFQIDREDKDLARHLLSHFATVHQYVQENFEYEDAEDAEDEQEEEDERKSTIMNVGYDVDPQVLCIFPQAVPAPIRDEFRGKVMLAFNFGTIYLWEKDAREVLNRHLSAAYFLLPAMKNADAALLGLAIQELAQRLQGNDTELGRHLTGMHLMLQGSEMMSDEEKLLVEEYLKPFSHLIKDDPHEE